MKKLVITSIVIAMIVSLGLAFGGPNGNGAPSGPHYNLNFIGLPKGVGYDKDLNDNFTGGNGARIFISRKGTTRVYVQGLPAPFQVLDHDGTDGVVGVDGLPGTPGIILPYYGGEYKCDIYVRIQGPKGSSVKIKGEYYEAGAYYPLGEFTLTKDGSEKFALHNAELLDDAYQDLLWTFYDKTKFRIVQMRIYVDEGY